MAGRVQNSVIKFYSWLYKQKASQRPFFDGLPCQVVRINIPQRQRREFSEL